MNDFFIHESAYVDDECHIGKGTKVWHFSHIMSGAVIGKKCVIGQNVYIGSAAKIGACVKIQNNVSVYDEVILEDNVFCGPSCVFTNVFNPRAFIDRNKEYKKTVVKRGATIGANATIICGISLGKYCLIGAGSVVTHDIPDYAIAYGNPARVHGWVCCCGEKLDKNLKCTVCHKKYIKNTNGLDEEI